MKTLKLFFLALIFVAPLNAADSAIEFRLVVPAETKGAAEKENDDTIVWVDAKAAFDSRDVKEAIAAVDQQQGWFVILSFTDEAGKRFGDFSKQHVGSRLAILSRGKLISTPLLVEAITGGSVQISGTFTDSEARELADAIKGESLKK